MQKMTSSKEYFQKMEQHLKDLNIQKYPILLSYFFSIKNDFCECEKSNNPETFFETVSKVLRLDAKLVLLGEEMRHMEYFGSTQYEVIQQIEQDSEYINKELCGYKMNESPHLSLLFNI